MFIFVQQVYICSMEGWLLWCAEKKIFFTHVLINMLQKLYTVSVHKKEACY